MNTKVQFVNYYNGVENVRTEIFESTTAYEAAAILAIAGWKISTDIPFGLILSRFDGTDSHVQVMK